MLLQPRNYFPKKRVTWWHVFSNEKQFGVSGFPLIAQTATGSFESVNIILVSIFKKSLLRKDYKIKIKAAQLYLTH